MRQITSQVRTERILVYLVGIFILSQLLGLKVLTFNPNLILQVIGILLVTLGILISISARISLSSNWSAGYEYQVKEKQKLVNKGIYKSLRHPIYLGMILILTGAELVVNSYLWIASLVIMSYIMTRWAEREEKLLTDHFGGEYKNYMKKSKMFLPYVY